MAQLSLSQARTRLRTRLGDVSGRGWSDTELNTYLSEGARDVTRLGETNLTQADVAVSAGTSIVTATPTDILRIYRVEWLTSDGRQIALEYSDVNNMDAIWWDQQNRSSAQPLLYTTQGYPPALRIQLYPIPADAGSVRVFYYKAAAPLIADTDLIDVPEGWDDIVLDYAEYRAYRRDGDDRWVTAKAHYDEQLAHLISTTRRYVEATGMIQNTRAPIPAWLYGDGGW